jgi:hypothetical protein
MPKGPYNRCSMPGYCTRIRTPYSCSFSLTEYHRVLTVTDRCRVLHFAGTTPTWHMPSSHHRPAVKAAEMGKSVADDGQENGDLEAWILFGWGRLRIPIIPGRDITLTSAATQLAREQHACLRIVDRRRSRHTIFNICNATRAQPVPRRPVGTMLPSGTARRIDWDTPRDSRRASDPRKIPEPYRRWALEGGFLAEFPHATGELSGRFGPGSPREYASP